MPRGAKHHPVDVHVGERLRTQRALYGMSQPDLAKRLGITFQQLQKYESGANRMSAGRIWQASRTLGAPVSYFFEGMDGKADPAASMLSTRAGLELVRAYEACPEEIRRNFYQLGKVLAEALASEDET